AGSRRYCGTPCPRGVAALREPAADTGGIDPLAVLSVADASVGLAPPPRPLFSGAGQQLFLCRGYESGGKQPAAVPAAGMGDAAAVCLPPPLAGRRPAVVRQYRRDAQGRRISPRQQAADAAHDTAGRGTDPLVVPITDTEYTQRDVSPMNTR